MDKTQALEALKLAEKEAGVAYAALEKRRTAFATAGRNPFDPKEEAEVEAIGQLQDAYEAAAAKTEDVKRIASAVSGIDLVRSGGRLPTPSGSSQGTAGAAFAAYARATNAASQPNGGAPLPSLVETFMGRPITEAATGYRAAVDGTSGGSQRPVMTGGLNLYPHRRVSILDLIPGEDVPGLGGETLHYLKQTAYTNIAAVAAQLAAKAQSTITIKRETTTLFTVATVSDQVPRQLLAGFGELEGWVNGELSAAVVEACEALCINGVGTTEPTGVLQDGGILTQASTGSPVEDIRRARTQLENVNIIPTALVLNPSDWESIELETDGDGQYLLGGPRGASDGQVWRVRVIPSTAIAAGFGLMGDFSLGAKRWSGMSRLAWGEVSDDFTKNALRCLAESGFGFAVTRANAFVKITL